jgi:hypothetical protein
MEPKHEGCYDCGGGMDQEYLTSVAAVRKSKKGVPQIQSIALCDLCLRKEQLSKK